MERVIKRVACITLAFALCFGYLGAKESVVETRHFKIIYNEETKNAAYAVYSFAEDVYSSLVSFFKEDPHIYLPIYINGEKKDYNAYYSYFPYNRIVLYDSPVNYTLDNCTDYYRTTFLHELTHAFVYNFKDGFGDVMVSLFGDWANVSVNLHLLMFLQEGISVYTESMDGGGRLNDPFYLSSLVEARMEGKEVSYMDASGGRDIKPYGELWYLYGGAFTSFVSEKYGERDLVEYFKKISKSLFSFPQNGYSSTFSNSLWNDWERFYYSVEIPSAFSEPEIVTSESRKYSNLVINNGSLYVFSHSKEGVFRVGEKEEKVYSFSSGNPNLSMREDGYFLIPYLGDTESSVLLYNEKGKKEKKFKGYHDGTFFLSSFLLSSSRDMVTYLDVVDDEGNVEKTIDLGLGVTVHEFTPSPDGAYFLLSKNGRERIAFLDKEYSLIIFDTPQEIAISSLSYNSSEVLTFSWAERGQEGEVGKYGEINLESMEILLSHEVFLGGVDYPVRDEEVVYFVSSFFDHSSVSVCAFEEMEVKSKGKCILSSFEKEDPVSLSDFLALSTPYKPSSTMTKGALIPLYIDTASFYESANPIGLTYYTMDASENNILTASSGYVKATDSLAFGLSLSSSIFTFSFTGDVNSSFFNWEGDFGVNLSSYLSHMGEKIGIGDVVGRVKRGGEKAFINYFYLSYENYRQHGIGRYHTFGWGGKFEIVNLDPSLTLLFSIPSLLPYNPLSPVDYGIPVKMALKADLEGIGAETTFHLLTYEVQKSIRFLSLYLVHLDLYFNTNMEYIYGEDCPSSDYALGLTGFLSPILGQLSRVQVELGVELQYNIKSGFKVKMVLGS